MIQEELSLIAQEWNTHHIRQRVLKILGCTKCVIFSFRANWFGTFVSTFHYIYHLDTSSYKHIFDCNDLEAAEKYSISKPAPASSEFIELVNLIMTKDEIEVPSNADEGLVLYIDI